MREGEGSTGCDNGKRWIDLFLLLLDFWIGVPGDKIVLLIRILPQLFLGQNCV
jgi:hypothetical protein